MPDAVTVDQGVDLESPSRYSPPRSRPKSDAFAATAPTRMDDNASQESSASTPFTSNASSSTANAGRGIESFKKENALSPYSSWTLGETAADSIVRIGRPSVPSIMHSLNSGPSGRRVRRIQLLARIGPDASDAVPTLVTLLNDPERRVRMAAARALGHIGPDAAPAVPDLLRLLDAEESDDL